MDVMSRLLTQLGLALVLSACAAPGRPAAAPSPQPTKAVPAAVAKHADTLGRAACAAWARQPRATDVTAVAALQATAARDATAAARLDPRWSALAKDLLDLRTLQAAYVKADVYHAYPLVPKLDALRKRIPSRC
ncbi:MAG: hypothetical protein JWM02_1790 [Frankiales bacterium]|nr:hypothetical protein [Frankiales bacterium]